jgi:hypothetical protein
VGKQLGQGIHKEVIIFKRIIQEDRLNLSVLTFKIKGM